MGWWQGAVEKTGGIAEGQGGEWGHVERSTIGGFGWGKIQTCGSMLSPSPYWCVSIEGADRVGLTYDPIVVSHRDPVSLQAFFAKCCLSDILTI